jgi:ketosteroid isomerase-like protein
MMAGCFLPAWDRGEFELLPFFYQRDGQIVMLLGAVALVLGLCGKYKLASIGGWLGAGLAALDFLMALNFFFCPPGIAMPVVFIGGTILISAEFVPERKTRLATWTLPASEKSRIRSVGDKSSTPREKTMKIQTNAPDPALVKAAAHSLQVYDDVYNNNDPEALANLFTEDAVLVTDFGIFHGRGEILQYQKAVFKACHFSDHKCAADLASIRPIGTDGTQFLVAGSWTEKLAYKGAAAQPMSGYWSAIVLTDGSGKDVMQTWNITPSTRQ